jgi:alpha-tubulin suppressor-like RCC1 family protein
MNCSRSFSSQACHSFLKLSNGKYICWGNNDSGSLGIGNLTAHNNEKEVTLPGEVTLMASGWHHVYALMKDGTLWGWGSNNAGQLGRESKDQSTPIPILMPNGLPVTWVASGADTGYAITQDGTLYAWGVNPDGQLGDGTKHSRAKPMKVEGLIGMSGEIRGEREGERGGERGEGRGERGEGRGERKKGEEGRN